MCMWLTLLIPVFPTHTFENNVSPLSNHPVSFSYFLLKAVRHDGLVKYYALQVFWHDGIVKHSSLWIVWIGIADLINLYCFLMKVEVNVSACHFTRLVL